jgi:subtilisin family serine protease
MWSYLYPGWGGRQPVAYVGDRPYRHPDDEIVGRRPVVGILDTGCGRHPWLDDLVQSDVEVNGQPIGYQGDFTSPEVHPDQAGPLDGVFDALSGHGTFIAGLVHQTCPDADILSWRVVPSEGPIVESDLIIALTQIAELAKRYRHGQPGGHALDVLNLSMGYYHEEPQDAAFDPIMLGILNILSDNGVVVVASAGNGSTTRPCYPAAFSRSTMQLPVVSVGALNPNNRTDALFSNTGGWVKVYRRGASVLSTFPVTFKGGLEPMARTVVGMRMRETIDPDDFSGGFGLWSGTSFAAPIAAGEIAAALVGKLELHGVVDEPAAAVSTARAAVGECFPPGE